MYKCGVCGGASKPGQPLIKYVVPKPDDPGQIAREVPLCRACAGQVRAGMTIRQIKQSIRNINEITQEVLAVASVRKRLEL